MPKGAGVSRSGSLAVLATWGPRDRGLAYFKATDAAGVSLPAVRAAWGDSEDLDLPR